MRMKSFSPRYEAQLILIAEPIPHPKHPPRTPSRRSSFFATVERAGTDSSILRGADIVAHHFHAVCGAGVLYMYMYVVDAVRPTQFGPQRELPSARLVTSASTT